MADMWVGMLLWSLLMFFFGVWVGAAIEKRLGQKGPDYGHEG